MNCCQICEILNLVFLELCISSYSSVHILVSLWDCLGRKAQTYKGITVEYLPWLVVAFSVWWYIRPCIVDGCSAVFSKTNVITRMKFPVSVLPATVCLRELFNHFVMLIITVVTLILSGWYPNLNWLWILYYMFCAFMLGEAISLVLSVLTMLWRDVKNLFLQSCVC